MNEKFKKALGLDKPKITLLILACALVLHFAFPRYIVRTGSMIPTIPPGSYVVTCSIPVFCSQVDKGDIVIFRPIKSISDYAWVHRITAVSGEKITTPDQKGRVDVSLKFQANHKDHKPEIIVIPEFFAYQCGDSVTSYHGLVPKELITGKVLFHFKGPWL